MLIFYIINYRTVVADAISELCLRLSGRAVDYFAIEWLLALPLYHLLSDRNKLGVEMQMDLKVDWPHYNTRLGLLKITGKAHAQKQ